MRRTKVAIVHSLMTSYRVPLFRRLLRDDEIDARIFINDRPSPNRPNDPGSGILEDQRVVCLPEIGYPPYIKGDEKIRFNTGIGKIFKWGPDVIVVFGYNEPTNLLVLMMSILKKVPFVLMAEVGPQQTPSLRRRLSGPLVGFIVRRAAGIGAASSSCERHFASLGASQKHMTRMPCMPDVSSIMNMSSNMAPAVELKKRFGLENKFVVVFLGRFLACKGIVEMFAAIDKVGQRFPDVVLVVAGFGLMDAFVKDECEKRGKRCIYYGIVRGHEELCALFNASDVHLMPSWYEGFGVVAAEALSCGLPTIVTSSSGCVDIVAHGENGLIINPRDPDAIADAIVKLRTDPALLRKMKAAAKGSVEPLNMDALYQRLKTMVTSATCSE